MDNSSIIVLERFNYAPNGTFGKWIFPNGKEFFSVELPWKGNKAGESCIPEGVYSLAKRYSPVVKRTSGGLFDEGWEVTDVPDRSYIMLHPGNWPHNFEGCIGMGIGYKPLLSKGGEWEQAVTGSREAFSEMMEIMEDRNEWFLDIRPKIIEYP